MLCKRFSWKAPFNRCWAENNVFFSILKLCNVVVSPHITVSIPVIFTFPYKREDNTCSFIARVWLNFWYSENYQNITMQWHRLWSVNIYIFQTCDIAFNGTKMMPKLFGFVNLISITRASLRYLAVSTGLASADFVLFFRQRER